MAVLFKRPIDTAGYTPLFYNSDHFPCCQAAKDKQDEALCMIFENLYCIDKPAIFEAQLRIGQVSVLPYVHGGSLLVGRSVRVLIQCLHSKLLAKRKGLMYQVGHSDCMNLPAFLVLKCASTAD